MAAICCHELALFPSEAPSGTHEAKKLPRIAARKRIAAISCHCRTPGSTFLSSASARGCITARSYHGRQPENTLRQHLATVGRWGAYFASILPLASARKRTKAKSCHGSPPENASGQNLAMADSPGMHFGEILPRPAPLGTHGVDTLPRQGTPGICGRDMLPLPVGAALARCRDEGAGGARGSIDPSAASGASALRPSIGTRAAVFSGSGGTAQPARCRVRRGVPIAGAWGPLGRSWVATTARTFIAGAPPFGGLIARSGFESALFRWATMGPFRVLRSSAVSCAEAKCALTFMLGAANVVKGMSWAFARQWEIWQAR